MRASESVLSEVFYYEGPLHLRYRSNKMSQCETRRFNIYLIFRLILYLALVPASTSQLLDWSEPPSIANSTKLRASARSLATARLHDDREALQSWAHLLENDTFLRGWRNESVSSPCDWQGVLCGEWEGELRVLGLNLNPTPASLAAAQPMPLGLGKLSGLRSLVLGAVKFSGAVPVDIGNCSNLEVLDISSNNFEPTLPGEIFAACDNLRILNASRCYFVGHLPDPLWTRCRNLEVLDLAYNEFTGNVIRPKGMSRLLSNLTTLDLSGNAFTGEMSSLLGSLDCSKLTHLDLSFNNFTSSVVPAELRNCSQLRNVMLRASSNFTGSIPEELGELQHLEYLQLGKNALTGTLPKSLLQCRRLWAMDVTENRLSGAIPGWLSAIPNLRYFSAYSNRFSGAIPLELGRAPKLIHIDISDNDLTGAIPPELGNLTTLRFLRLKGNRLVSSLPASLGNLRELRGLDLSANSFTGSIPATFGSLHKLRWLQMEVNRFTGSLPPELGNCRSLLWLNLNNNRLSGEIPPALYSMGSNVSTSYFTQSEVDEYYPAIRFGYCAMVKLWIPDKNEGADIEGWVDDDCRPLWTNQLLGNRVLPLLSWLLSRNSLSGSIPVPKRPISYLLMLIASQNLLTGSIPANISQLVLLFIVDVARNRIDGAVPDIFTPMARTLEGLDVSENRLEGQFPASLNNLSSLRSYNFSFNPRLMGAVPFEGHFRNFNPNAYLGNSLLCRGRDPHEVPDSQTMRYCDAGDSPGTDATSPTEESTKFSVLDYISVPGFVLGAGVGFLGTCIVCQIYCFRLSRRRAAKLLCGDRNRVGAWQPPT